VSRESRVKEREIEEEIRGTGRVETEKGFKFSFK
jgi:hypothetical protein